MNCIFILSCNMIELDIKVGCSRRILHFLINIYGMYGAGGGCGVGIKADYLKKDLGV